MGNKEEELEQLEEELAELEALGESGNKNYGSPSPEKKDNMFKFFREVLTLPESWKVGNLKEEEIGKSRLGVRAWLELAAYADAEKQDLIKDYFIKKANIVAEPTMGRKGFMAQLFVTQIRKEQKVKAPEQKKKGFLFGGGNKNENTEQ